MEGEKNESSNGDEKKNSIEHILGITNNFSTLKHNLGLHENSIYSSGIFEAATKINSHFIGINSLKSSLVDFNKMYQLSPAIDMLKSSSIAIKGLSSVSAINAMTESIAKHNNYSFKNDIINSALVGNNSFLETNPLLSFPNLKSRLSATELSSLALQTSFSKTQSILGLSEKSLSSFSWTELGSLINIGSSTKHLVSNRFSDLSKDYSNLYKSFEVNPISYTEISPIITKNIPIEFYTGASLLETISNTEISKDKQEESSLQKEIVIENESSLTQFLPQINPGLLTMWQGANDAYYSDNRDKVRHFMVSLRELFTHVMQNLAPDKEIVNWSSNPKNFDKGRPTRKARLSYIYRNISNDEFHNFVNSDVETTLSFINIFQKGTHNINNTYNENQLLAIKSKAEATLKFLLDIHFNSIQS